MKSSISDILHRALRRVWAPVLIVLVSLFIAFAFVFAADRVFGKWASVEPPPDNGALIFPPESVNTFKTVSFSYTARCNALGLREREIAPGKSDAYRIVALGDSFTYGWGVESEQTWLRVLEGNLKRVGLCVETVNCGKPGEGPPFYDALARRVIPLLRPDLVIVGVLQGNDLSACWPGGRNETRDAVREWTARLFPHFVWYMRNRGWLTTPDPYRYAQGKAPEMSAEESAELSRRCSADGARAMIEKMPPEVRARYDRLDDTVKQHFLSGGLNAFTIDFAAHNPGSYVSILDLDSTFVKECIDGMAHHLRSIQRTAARYGARVVVVALPFGMYVNTHAYETMQRLGFSVEPGILTSDAPDRPIEMACERADVPFYSVMQAFRDRKDDASLYFDFDEHLSAAGHAAFADAITPFIEEEIRNRGGGSSDGP